MVALPFISLESFNELGLVYQSILKNSSKY